MAVLRDGDGTFIAHIAEAEVRDEAKSERCPEHPNASSTGGFGLAGGGFGAYDVCDECGRVFNKIDLGEFE
jgi:hypothetical protein